jgi:hypothetical protein
MVGCLHDTHIFFFSIYFVRIAHEYAGFRLPNKIMRKAWLLFSSRFVVFHARVTFLNVYKGVTL